MFYVRSTSSLIEKHADMNSSFRPNFVHQLFASWQACLKFNASYIPSKPDVFNM